jgi:DNA-binding CsgD family transcriptional regulator
MLHPLLTKRENEILDMVAQGMTNKQIGTQLGISWRTIKNHMKKIRVKLGAKNSAHAVAIGKKLL